jgi:hypothetical protein
VRACAGPASYHALFFRSLPLGVTFAKKQGVQQGVQSNSHLIRLSAESAPRIAHGHILEWSSSTIAELLGS